MLRDVFEEAGFLKRANQALKQEQDTPSLKHHNLEQCTQVRVRGSCIVRAYKTLCVSVRVYYNDVCVSRSSRSSVLKSSGCVLSSTNTTSRTKRTLVRHVIDLMHANSCTSQSVLFLLYNCNFRRIKRPARHPFYPFLVTFNVKMTCFISLTS